MFLKLHNQNVDFYDKKCNQMKVSIVSILCNIIFAEVFLTSEPVSNMTLYDLCWLPMRILPKYCTFKNEVWFYRK